MNDWAPGKFGCAGAGGCPARVPTWLGMRKGSLEGQVALEPALDSHMGLRRLEVGVCPPPSWHSPPAALGGVAPGPGQARGSFLAPTPALESNLDSSSPCSPLISWVTSDQLLRLFKPQVPTCKTSPNACLHVANTSNQLMMQIWKNNLEARRSGVGRA